MLIHLRCLTYESFPFAFLCVLHYWSQKYWSLRRKDKTQISVTYCAEAAVDIQLKHISMLDLRTSRGGKQHFSAGRSQWVITLWNCCHLFPVWICLAPASYHWFLLCILTTRLKNPSACSIFSTIPIDFCPHLFLQLIWMLNADLSL